MEYKIGPNYELYKTNEYGQNICFVCNKIDELSVLFRVLDSMKVLPNSALLCKSPECYEKFIQRKTDFDYEQEKG